MANTFTPPTWIKGKPHASAEKQVGDSDPSSRTDVINRPDKGLYANIRRLVNTLFDGVTMDFTDQSTVTALLSGIRFAAGPLFFLNDTANAKMTIGITINQGANDDEALTLKSSDVAHGMTDITETDTYGFIRKDVGATGGLRIEGFAGDYEGLFLRGCAISDNTVKNTAALGYIHLRANKRSGAGPGVTTVGADANLVVISNDSTTRFIFDGEGSAHGDVEWIAFDAHDDVALLEGLEAEFSRRRDPLRGAFGAWLVEGRAALEREKVVCFYDNGPRAMVNFTRLSMLHTGAIRQLAAQVEALRRKVGLVNPRPILGE